MKNKLIITITILFLLLSVASCFKEIISDYMPTIFEYNTVKENCPGEKAICSKFKSQEELDTYLANNPREKFDTITLASYVVETTTNFGLIAYISPLIMILLVIFQIQDEISSGYIENMLTRTAYKKILKKYILVAAKTALLIPLMYAIILLISALITNFNFTNITTEMIPMPEIDTFKYNHFFAYFLILTSSLYLLHFAYSLIGVFMSFISKNKVICTVLGYIYFIVLDLASMVFGSYVIKRIFGFDYGANNYFNLIGHYWFFDDTTSPLILYLVIIGVIFINLSIIYILIGRKEKAIKVYEKQVI
ncbi:MAG: hypothetical protein PUC82_02860 [bacterium]|nr:hypothetical protein [bacterium]